MIIDSFKSYPEPKIAYTDHEPVTIETKQEEEVPLPMEPSDLLKESSNPLYHMPIYINHPSTLNQLQQDFIEEMLRQIKRANLFCRSLPFTDQYPITPLNNIRRLITSSYGMVSLNLRQRCVNIIENNVSTKTNDTIWEGCPFAHVQTGMAYQFGLPLLLIRENGVEKNGIWSFGINPFLSLEWDSTLPNPVKSFFDKNEWKSIFQNWVSQVISGYYIQTQPPFKYSANVEI